MDEDIHELESIPKVTVRRKQCYTCGRTIHTPEKCFSKTVNAIHVIKWYIYINVFKQGNSGAYETKEEVNDELCSEYPESDHSEDNGENKHFIIVNGISRSQGDKDSCVAGRLT